MKIGSGIEALEVSANVMGKPSVIYPTLLWDADTVVLVDTGFPGMLSGIMEAMAKAGVPFEKLTKIIITHQDIDHIGSLSSILKEAPVKPEVLAHKEEKPYIQGEKRAIKLAQMDARAESLPEQMKPIYEGFKSFYSNNKIAVDKALDDGEELPYCGGIKVIHTPGHTPGHICLYHKQSKTLITGDAMAAKAGTLAGPSAQATYDMNLAISSLKKLAQYDIQTAICYHGGVVQGDVPRRLTELAME